MIGRITFKELRNAWKVILVICMVTLIYSVGMPTIFPLYRSSIAEELEGASKVQITLPNETHSYVTLSWEALENSTSYIVLEDNRSMMLTAEIKYEGNETSITFEKDFTEKRYYAVMATIEGASEPSLIGIATTEKSDPFKELLDNPVYRSFAGGRSISMLEVKGFITMEFFILWTMLAGMFIAYLSVSILAGDFENRHMDIWLSKPITRRRYLAEKFAAMTTISLIVSITAAIGLIAGLASINSLNELSAYATLISVMAGLPTLMVIAAVGTLSAVSFQKVRAGMGISFAFVFAQLFLRTFGSFSKDLELMKIVSVFTYWDYTAAIFDTTFNAGDFTLLIVVSLLIIAAAIWIFKKKDIPT
ncbi:MAG: ABC transporter permease subunit [Candidatus Bathyarchaeota archaeon]|jgi:ABC-2 type transport system permease protein|nr:MAG: ABC transporter permease subunit [Candidatus Bathyarchaeota archaeon]